ncbi:hypothetical protein [Flavobacterium sp. MMS24-S5]|uniref:hypothetical protein n=1 Tax=Flavobacterium sp. MMS24-S5 TaxID=3416605 RepID=UPI003D06C423
MKLFAEKKIDQLFSEVEEKINSCIFARKQDALNKEIKTFAKDIYELIAIKTTLRLKKEETTVNTNLKSVPTNRLSYDVRMFANKNSYELACVNYFIPFQGNSELFKYQPRKHSNFTYEGNFRGNVLHFELQTQYANVNLDKKTETEVSNTITEVVEKIEENISQVHEECNNFNDGLEEKIIKAIEEFRKNDNERKERENRLNPFK